MVGVVDKVAGPEDELGSDVPGPSGVGAVAGERGGEEVEEGMIFMMNQVTRPNSGYVTSALGHGEWMWKEAHRRWKAYRQSRAG
jgi:hypothetical protein